MKTTAIPAQITTVEDRIAGNLSLNQLILLSVPLFFSAVDYFCIPHFGHLEIYKLGLMLLVFMVFGVMSIRLKGKLVVSWLALRMRYEFRPRIYIYSKSNRQVFTDDIMLDSPNKVNTQKNNKLPKTSLLSLGDLNHGQQLLNDPNLVITFKVNKQGGLNVQVAKI